MSEWLRKSPLWAPASAFVRGRQSQISTQLAELGVESDTELGQFYLNYPPECVRGWYELNRIEDVRRATEFAQRELGVGSEYLALTGVEGDGITLYHRATGKVFDVQFGQFEALEAESLPQIASSFVEYLRWCRSKDIEDV